MLYLKSVAAGIVTAVVASLVWILATLVLPVFVPLLWSGFIDDGTGSGGVGAVSVNFSVNSAWILVVALAGFGVGFWWTLRRVKTR